MPTVLKRLKKKVCFAKKRPSFRQAVFVITVVVVNIKRYIIIIYVDIGINTA